MQKSFRLFLWCALIMSACSALPAAPPTIPASTTAAPTPKQISTVSTPHIDQPPDPENCGYQWAYQDLPELSSSFQQSVQALQPEAQATTFAFGENCILSDGSVGAFLPMETDFNITLQVRDLTDESNLGEWVVKVMQIIATIPPQQILGPRPGRVSITFQSSANQKVINFYINQYQELSPGLNAAEIFRQLQIAQ